MLVMYEYVGGRRRPASMTGVCVCRWCLICRSSWELLVLVVSEVLRVGCNVVGALARLAYPAAF